MKKRNFVGPSKDGVSLKERKRMKLAMMKVIAEDEEMHQAKGSIHDMTMNADAGFDDDTVKNEIVSSLSSMPPLKTNRTSSKPLHRRQRVLVFCSRGITERYRHLMNDVKTLLPHHKADVKMDNKDDLKLINEICEMKSCNKAIYFECRKKKDLYMWFGNTPHGPSAKFHVVNVHTMNELKLTGNALLGSRPILHFDKAFNDQPQLTILKELFSQIFNTPRLHNKSKPFIDHILGFFIVDDKIWIRNYQIMWPSRDNTLKEKKMIEIGPRFVLIPVRIFGGSFGGPTLYRNQAYQSPNELRREAKMTKLSLGEKKEKQAKNEELIKKVLSKRPIDGLSGHHLFKAPSLTDDLTGISTKKRRIQSEEEEDEEEEEFEEEQDDEDDEEESE